VNYKYYKKIDRSMMDWGFTLPKDSIDYFDPGRKIQPGKYFDVEIEWGKKVYSAKLWHINRKIGKVYQLRWHDNQEFLKKIRKTFIQSYVILKSQKELFDLKKEKGKYFRTKLQGGQQEVLIFEPLDSKKIKCKIFIKITNEWNTLFERLADENVFGWLFQKNKSYLISRSTKWIDVGDFKKHAKAQNVIYYLANTKKKLLYIGKAENLGKRVKPGKQHQDMSDDWDKFRYDILKLEYSNILDKVEDHTIRAFASVFENNKAFPSLNSGGYKLVNKNWRKL
jgi:hypothetical protein